MTLIGTLAALLCIAFFMVMFSPRNPRPVTPEPQELEPGETLKSLTADLENVMAEAVRELDIIQPYITRENWRGLDEVELRKRQRARRMYINALEAWRKAEECVKYDGKGGGNIDLRMIGSVPLVRKAGIFKARQSIERSKEAQDFLGLNS